MDYLPKDATIEEACNWLQAKTGQTWVLPRLLECHLRPHFWLDYKPGYPAIYGDRIEGYQTRMMFQGDLCRLESDRGDALVNIFTAHDGTLVKVQPALRVPLSELKFKRESVERVAEIINKTAQNAATPAPLTDRPSNAPAWTVNKPQRYSGYAAPLHRLLAAAHRDGNPCPTARDVVETWRHNAPAEIAKVLPDGFDYYDANGNTKTAGIDAIRNAIKRMTSAR